MSRAVSRSMARPVPAVSASNSMTPPIHPLHDSRRCLYVMSDSLRRRDAGCQLRVQENAMTCPDCGREVERRAVRLGGRSVARPVVAGLFLARLARRRPPPRRHGGDAEEPAADVEALAAGRGAGRRRRRDRPAASPRGVSGVRRRVAGWLRRDGRRIDPSRAAARRWRGGGGLRGRRRGGGRPQRRLDRRRARDLQRRGREHRPLAAPGVGGLADPRAPAARPHQRHGLRHLARLRPHPRSRGARRPRSSAASPTSTPRPTMPTPAPRRSSARR